MLDLHCVEGSRVLKGFAWPAFSQGELCQRYKEGREERKEGNREVADGGEESSGV